MYEPILCTVNNNDTIIIKLFKKIEKYLKRFIHDIQDKWRREIYQKSSKKVVIAWIA
jgi:hypothetical protein